MLSPEEGLELGTRLEIFMVMKMQVVVVWVMSLCSDVVGGKGREGKGREGKGRREGEGRKDLVSSLNRSGG
jgi:hypothetical protein